MNIGITGHTGFIGKALVESLKMNKHLKLILFDKRQHSLEEIKSLEDFVKNTDVIIHLAGTKNTPENYGVNVLGTKNLLEAVTTFSPTTNIIFSSSFAVYTDTTEIIQEDRTETLPISHYGLSKLFAEQLLHFYQRQYNIPIRILRIANVYGPRFNDNEPDIVSRLINKIESNKMITIHDTGNQTRDFIYLDDVVEAFIQTTGYTGNSLVVNICTGKKISVNSVISHIEKVVHKKAKIKFNTKFHEKGSWIGDPTKAQKLLHFTAKTDFMTGLQKTINLQKGHII